jgi:hypothetical protein
MYSLEELEQKAARRSTRKRPSATMSLDSFDRSFVPHKYLAEEEICATTQEEQQRLIMSGLDVTDAGRGGTYFQKDTTSSICTVTREGIGSCP